MADQELEGPELSTSSREAKLEPEAQGATTATSEAIIEEVPAKPRRSRRLAKPEQPQKEEKLVEASTEPGAKSKDAGQQRVLTQQEQDEGMLIKPLLIQERVRDDLWKMLVATCLLNVTTGRAARPIFWQILDRWPTPEKLGMANKEELEELIAILGLGDVRSNRLILFSRQYAESIFHSTTPSEESHSDASPYPWSPILAPVKSPKSKSTLPTSLEGLTRESIYGFAGVGQYAMDSFAIYSPLLPGGGAPKDEALWLSDDVVDEESRIVKRSKAGASLDDRDDSGDAWRKVMPNDKELVKYLAYRWAVEGIEWNQKRGPVIVRPEDAKRLGLTISGSTGQEEVVPDAMEIKPVAKETIDLRLKREDVMNEEEAATNNETKQAPRVVEDDWRLRLPAFLRSNLDLPTSEEPEQEASSSTHPGIVDPNAPNPLSKNAMKKAAKLAKMEAQKPNRRAQEKEKAKARKASQKADYEAGKMTPEEAAEYLEKVKDRTDKLNAKQRGGRVKDQHAWRGGLIVDLGFDDLMNQGEIKSMASQLSYCHSSNRLTTKPFLNIVFSSFNGQLKERMDTVMKAHYNVWTRTEWRPEDVSQMMRGNASKEESGVNNPFPGQTYVYLTADTDNELETLREDETYIIGGIVDKNRYKNLCRDKADRLGIKTARLPIGTYIEEMPTRKVLTVNQVFDIMVKYNECKDWRVAFETVIPKRKFKAESRTVASRGHKRAWEERDSSTSSPQAGEHKHMREDHEDDDEEDDGDEADEGDEVVVAETMDVEEEEAALNTTD